MSLIQTPEQLADAIRNDPQRVAECLHRINRFGGQARSCDVLQHSLEVYRRLNNGPANVRLWALLHDCHEILTGDVVRPYAGEWLTHQQGEIDSRLRKELGITLTAGDAIAVRAADIDAGNYELERIRTGEKVYPNVLAVAVWCNNLKDLF